MVHHCPRCDLRFRAEAEVTEHLALDHHAPHEAWERYRYPTRRRQPPLYEEDVEAPADAPRRYLLVGNLSLQSPELAEHVHDLVARGPCSFTVLVPATPASDYPLGAITDSGSIAGTGEPQDPAEEGTVQARWRLRRTVETLRALGADAHGMIAPPEPFAAVQELLRGGSFDGIVVSTLPALVSRWLDMDLPRRLERTAHIPVTVVEAGDERA